MAEPEMGNAWWRIEVESRSHIIAEQAAEIERLWAAIAWYGDSDPDAMNAIIYRVAALASAEQKEQPK